MKSIKYLALLILIIPFLFSCESTTETNKVANPVISPSGGTYTTSQLVTITDATDGATILYTTDGTDPIATSATYNGAINVTTNMTIKAKAIKDGWDDSDIVSASYIVFSDMIRISAGTFTMGRTVGSSTYADELPTHSVTLSRPYYIGKYEVTQAEYTAIMGTNPSQFNGTSNPVEKVSWYHTLVYCNKRSIAEGLTPVYSISGSTDPNTWGSVPGTSTSAWNNPVINWNADGYRLPTEAEWEYAARGGATSPDYVYSGSNDPQNYAWYSENASGATHQVGYKSANGLGLFDMSGNVSEWVWDWYSETYYSVSPATDPTGPTSGTLRVHRGGSWFHGATQIRVAYRDWGTPENSAGKVYTNRLGFRVVRTTS